MNRTTTHCLLLSAALLGLASAAYATPTQFTFGREAHYTQSGASTVALDTSNPYRGVIDVSEDSATSVFSAGTITSPSSSQQSLTYSAEDESWDLEYDTTSLTTLNTNIPTGTYTLNMTKVASGTTTTTFSLTSLTMPDAPVISNYTALQSIDVTSALTISWGSWTAGTSSDFIIVRIEKTTNGDKVFELAPGDTGALTGTATSATVPANTLTSGMSYTLSVQFIKGFSYSASGAISDYPSAMKACYASAQTKMTIKAAGSLPLNDLVTFTLWNNINYHISASTGSVTPTSSVLPGTAGETIYFNMYSDTSVDNTAVVFTAPTTISGAGADRVSHSTRNSQSLYSYAKDCTPYLTDGTYSIVYNGTTYTGSVTDAPGSSDQIYFVPTITLSSGKITGISWATYGYNLSAKDISAYPGSIMLQIQNASYNDLYEVNGMSPSTTSVDLSSQNISLYDAKSISLVYMGASNEVELNNQMFTTYWIDANIFSSLTHSGNWVQPYDTIVNSFGWINDGSYPWIYSISEDTLANGGTYMADNKGWFYIWADGASLTTGGFYFYRSSTAAWCWTSYYWAGWIYDYSIGWVDITPKS